MELRNAVRKDRSGFDLRPELTGVPARVRAVSLLFRAFPFQFPGRARLCRRMLGPHSGLRNFSIRGRCGSRFLLPSLEEPIAFYLFCDGLYERQTFHFLMQTLGPSSTFVDVGANIGCLTLFAALKVGVTGKVIAIEASPRVFAYLRHNIESNRLGNVVLRNCAVGEHVAGSIDFYEAPIEKFGMGSLAAQFDASPTPVPSTTLDRLLADEHISIVHVMKVDVEGFEAAVFKGSERLLTGPSPPIVVFEFCDWAERRATGTVGDSQRLLKKYGYTLWRIQDFPKGRPLEKELSEGYAMLVAKHVAHPTERGCGSIG